MKMLSFLLKLVLWVFPMIKTFFFFYIKAPKDFFFLIEHIKQKIKTVHIILTWKILAN